MNLCERFIQDYHQSKMFLPGLSLPWLTAERENALESLCTQGLPDIRDENWKYTKIKQLEQKDYCSAKRLDTPPGVELLADLLSNKALDKRLFPGEHRLVFINGHYIEDLSSVNLNQEGMVLHSFAQALQDHEELLSSTLGSIAGYEEQPFAALNTSMMSDGVFLLAQQNTRVNTPIHCLFISTATEQAVVSYPRLLLVLEDNAVITLVEHYLDITRLARNTGQTLANGNLTNSVTEIRLGPHARMNHYKLQYDSFDSSHISAMYVEQQRASAFTSHSYSLGAALARHDIQIRLDGRQAECILNGAYLVGGRQHVDYHTQIDHVAPGCSSQQIYKGVIQGRARAVFNGKVIIHPQTQQSAAKQLNKNLLLGKKAEVDSKPELQIYADDVKCSHGATVGQLDELALFYLQSRGICKKDAESWLVFGFVSEVLNRIDNPDMREFVLLPVLAHLNQLVGGDVKRLQEIMPAQKGTISCQ
ncbi:Fe-S cluster assembly protein SufD [Thalassotalea sp. 42_200_T64]|nr:Fe-S cluster assembly protein SufD [Thalassotalea sp. 42_200_T64]